MRCVARRVAHPLPWTAPPPAQRYEDCLPPTYTSSLWCEATAAYNKFQGADPITHPEVGRFKQ